MSAGDDDRPDLRETFATRVGMLLAMVGLAVGLGNVWRFPYMVGRYGGAAFILVYLVLAILVGIPALMAEWALGRHTRRGPVGAYERAGVPGGRWVGWTLFGAMAAATAYYANAIGWVVWHGLASASTPIGAPLDGALILPPSEGFAPASFGLQFVFTALVLGGCALVVVHGVRAGIERASRVLTPALFGVLVILTVRSLTLPGAGEGLRWLLAFEASAVTPSVVVAALGQMVFSLGIGGMMMVMYGSYLDDDEPLAGNAVWTVAGDTCAGLLAGLAIFPAVLAFGLEPGSGPGLLFVTLPGVFGAMPAGWIFGTLFFAGLAGAAFLSAVASFEVLVGGLHDNTRFDRRGSAKLVFVGTLVLALAPMINLRVFVPWDLTFGSGTQTAGALIAALTFGWALDRGAALEALSRGGAPPAPRLLRVWIKFVVPGAILAVGTWWLLTDVLGLWTGV